MLGDKTIELSIVVPVYNEEESLSNLYSELCTTLQRREIVSEIIFVDDGSSDQGVKAIQRRYVSCRH